MPMDSALDIAGLVVCLFLAVGIHEFGHFAIAYILKRPLARVEVGTGPLLYFFTWKGINFRLYDIPLGGKTLFVFGSRKKWVNLSIMFAGPVANLLTWYVMYCIDGNDMLARISLMMAMLNLMPFRTENINSDGHQIMQEWRKNRTGIQYEQL